MRVIDCKHRSQWRHQQILHSTVPYGRGIWEKESIIGVQWFQKNPNPRVHRSVGNSASLVSHCNRGPSGWDFSVPFFLSFSIYCLALGFEHYRQVYIHDCTLRVAGWKPTSNHIEITIGFFNLHRGWLSLHRGHPVNVPIRKTMHLSSVIPANDTRESVFGHRNFSRRERESNLGPLAPEASA